MKFDFVIFLASLKWSNAVRRPHYQALKKYGRLIIIEPGVGFFSKIRKEDEVWIINFSWLIKLWPKLLNKKIRKLLKNKPAAIYPWPQWSKYFNSVNNAINIFEANDAFSLYPHLSSQTKQKIKNQEEFLARNCDIVFCTSSKLQEKYKKINKNSFWIPNTTNVLNLKEYKQPPEFENIKNKKIGFAGNINDWLDLDLIKKIAKKNENFDFIFVGQVNGTDIFQKKWQDLISLENIIYLGWQAPEKLWYYINSFDICWIPYKTTEFLSYVHPNKIYQYLACGKPVIASEFLPETKYFNNLVEFGDLESLIQKENYFGSPEQRINFAKDHAPDKRADKIYSLLLNQLNVK